ncbi:hypothetical protein SAMN05421640_0426 [Ekhidna lutea]|uniref:PorZ N-terminal beta-propeller domain-containing protein n=1 Tax=Ekhidna lutea TaxID=447679 RepID=A0A239F131_EKHLU|nr:hypothetical protein [Ekhidna lutea]SNS50411.1 hypothetical protein SAMN05421640_0426 [Ekhidna lutea]
MKRFADLAFLRRLALSSLVAMLLSGLFAQDIAVGTWRTHFSYKNAQHLVSTPDKIFCASETGLFSRDLLSGETRKLSKVDGLSDVGISAMAYNDNQNVLVLGYRSGFVDFVFEDRIRSISDLAKSSLNVDKTINDIAFTQTRTYLATDLGVIVVNTASGQIVENFIQIGAGGNEVRVLEIISQNNSLIIRTDEGIQSGNLDQNLLDFSNWNMYVGTAGFSSLTLASDNLFALSGERLMQLNSSWADTGVDLPASATRIFNVNNQLVTSDKNGILYEFSGSGFDQLATTQSSAVNAIVSIDGQFFLADGMDGLQDVEGNSLSPDGPISDIFSNFRVLENNLYGFHAPSPFSYAGNVQYPFYSFFSNGRWEITSIEGFTNVSDVAIMNGNRYFSSIGDGLYDEFNEEIITDIPQSSSSLDTVITALAGGDQLWVSSFSNNNPLHILGSDNVWSSFTSTQLFDNEFLTIDISEFGVAWLGSSSGTITVFEPFEENADIISTSDGLPSAFIDVDISVEDNAWVGTSKGPAVFDNASFIFSFSEALRPSFEGRTLFEDQSINAVLTDGGNRIWFGTNNGLWVFDENVSKQVAVFNESNSPLPSNRIIQLDYNSRNGEVFVLTDNGMVSYRSASSIGQEVHQNVNIFPNPVRPNYDGLVGLTGLANNVNIKVTDINGNLVQELDANGGSSSWDLTYQNGGKVSTGVYLFFSSTSSGEETYVGKIAVIR